ncbi:MAG: hypothetical protein LBT09_05930 [Planctomycetaceae bacterium]|jgi:hypothetical protein|nr:hypothetical protein [Planctomycetaceae bacterium]
MTDYSIEELVGAAQVIETTLNQHNIKHLFTGGLVASFYGEPRLTQDVDIVAAMTGGQLNNLLESLKTEFFFNKEVILAEFPKSKIFQVIHKKTMVKIDFHLENDISEMLRHSVKNELLIGLNVSFTSRSDAIISKLNWIKKGSHKSRKDVRMMFCMANKTEQDKITQLVEQKNLKELFNEVLTEEID